MKAVLRHVIFWIACFTGLPGVFKLRPISLLNGILKLMPLQFTKRAQAVKICPDAILK